MKKKLPAPEIKINGLCLTEKRSEHKESGGGLRQDRYFCGTITINKKSLPLEVHLMKFAEGWGPDWYMSANIGDKKPDAFCPHKHALAETCAICDGNQGRGAGPIYSGDTGWATFLAVKPVMEKLGFKITEYTITGHGGWYCFDVYVETLVAQYRKVSRRQFYHEEYQEVLCPVHGKYLMKRIECSL